MKWKLLPVYINADIPQGFFAKHLSGCTACKAWDISYLIRFSYFFLSEVLALEKLQYLFHFLSLEFKDALSGWKQQTNNLSPSVLYKSLKDMCNITRNSNNCFAFISPTSSDFLVKKTPSYLRQNYTSEAFLTAMKQRPHELLLTQRMQRPTWLPTGSIERN